MVRCWAAVRGTGSRRLPGRDRDGMPGVGPDARPTDQLVYALATTTSGRDAAAVPRIDLDRQQAGRIRTLRRLAHDSAAAPVDLDQADIPRNPERRRFDLDARTVEVALAAARRARDAVLGVADVLVHPLPSASISSSPSSGTRAVSYDAVRPGLADALPFRRHVVVRRLDVQVIGSGSGTRNGPFSRCPAL
jgi:hypothetical protein